MRSGGTNCSAPLALLNRERAVVDVVILVSDNESWVDARGQRGTAMMKEWQVFKARNPRATLVCIDLQPSRTMQAIDRADILNVGGFSDQVFEVMSTIGSSTSGADAWVKTIERVPL